MNKTLIALALTLGLGLAGCSRNASDQPEDATAAAPSLATPNDRTAELTPPTATDTSDATAATTGINSTSDTVGDAGMGDAMDGSANDGSAMGGTRTDSTITGYSNDLQQALQRCDQLSGAERDTCRADAQARYDQDTTTAPTTPR